jgi:hypothetical protein
VKIIVKFEGNPIKPSQPEDLFRLSSDAGQGRIIAYIQLSTEVFQVSGQRLNVIIFRIDECEKTTIAHVINET